MLRTTEGLTDGQRRVIALTASRDSLLHMGRDYDDLNAFDRYVLALKRLHIHTTEWDSSPTSSKTPCGRKVSSVILGNTFQVTCRVCQRYNDGI